MNDSSISIDTNPEFGNATEWIPKLRNEIGNVIVGQSYLIDRLIVGLLANGHVLIEGVPGLAKTLSIRTLASVTDADLSVSSTPDAAGRYYRHTDIQRK